MRLFGEFPNTETKESADAIVRVSIVDRNHDSMRIVATVSFDVGFNQRYDISISIDDSTNALILLAPKLAIPELIAQQFRERLKCEKIYIFFQED